ncbi:hypothetical protein [Deinococcus frigens]|uniref:hypothetical protein n=1 Tax=Deinococcus frigens TaxID=249403 RepID=UPI0004958D35|nr:hypothetical protein [Deinococcus frigens]
MPHGTYQPDRKDWLIQVGPYVLTPASPGPPGADWQLAGVWSLTYGPLGECRYGELGCTADPGLLLDSYPIELYEHPPYERTPDFRGVVGVTRGNRTPELGAYTLALVGEGDLDADGLAIYSEYTKLGAGMGLTPKPDETVAAFHERILEPWGDGGWGVRGDGAKVVGRPSGGPVFTEAQVHGYTSSGQQRRDYVTETSASPGDRWKRLYDTRALPLPYAPRRYAPAGTDNLLLPDVETPTPLSYTTNPLPYAAPLDLSFDNQPVVEVTGGWPEPSAETRNYLVSIPLSAVVRGSAGWEGAQGAEYSLQALSVVLGATLTSFYGPIDAVIGVNFNSSDYDVVRTPGGLEVTAQHWISRNAQGSDPDIAISTVISARAAFAYPRSFGPGPGQPPPQEWAVQIVPEADFLETVYQTLNGGTYWWKVALKILATPHSYRYTRKANADTSKPGNQYARVYRQDGRYQFDVRFDAPKMVQDKLVDAIPPDNYPPGWDAPSVSAPTFQGEVPGVLWPPARVGALYVTEARTIRTHERQWTELQTGARQTQKLLSSEARLKTAIDNRQGQGGAW